MIGAGIARVTGLMDRFASSAVLLREAARTSRRWQTYAARTGFSGALFGVLLLGIWASLNAPNADASNMAWMGRAIFVAFSVVLLLMAIVLSPLFTSSALIEETEDRTLEMLILSKLEPAQILSGKVLSRILLLITVVFGAMPVMAMVVTLGGVAPQAVVAVTVHTLVAVVLMGALGAFFGLFTKAPMLAMAASASYAVPVFLLLPLGYALSTGHPQDAVHFSLFGGSAAEDWSSPIALFSYVPSLVVIQVIGTRLFELKVSNADIRRAFAAETWSTKAWVIGLIVATVTGFTVLPAASVGAYTLRYATTSLPSAVQQVGVVVSVGVIWLWWTFAATLLTWALLRVGVDVVDAMDAILGGRNGKRRDRSAFRVWNNPVAWREARPGAAGSNGVPVIVTWLLIMLGMVQTGWWIIPGGALVMGVMNTVAALGLALWLATRAIEEERRTGAFDVLLTTTMPSWSILAGKAAGVAVPSLPLLLLSMPFFAFGVPHLHMFDLEGGNSPVNWFARGVATWLWTLPLWAALVSGGMWTALRVKRRSAFGVASGAMLVVLGVPTVLGRLFAEVPVLAVPSRMIAPPLAGEAEFWQYGVAMVGWTGFALGTLVWTGIGLRRWIAGAFGLLLALGVAVSPARAQQVPPQDGFLMAVEPLADGVVRPGSWAAVRVRIANLDGNARGWLTVVERDGTESRSFSRPVELPQRTRKDVVLLLQPNTSNRDRVIELTTESGRRASVAFTLTQASPEDATIAVIGTDMLGIQAILETWSGAIPGPRPRLTESDPRRVRRGLVDPLGMPSHSAGWQAFDQVVWRQADPSALSPGQVDALDHWVADGGHLLLTVTENWQALQGSTLGRMLPMTFTGTEDRSDLGGALGALGGDAAAGLVPMAVGTIDREPGRSTFVRSTTDEGVPLLVTGTYGLGTVTVFTADPGGAAFRGNVPTEGLWRALLGLPTASDGLQGGVRAISGERVGSDGAVVPWSDPSVALGAALHLYVPQQSVLHGTTRWQTQEWSDDPGGLWETEVRRWLADVPGVAPLPMSWLLAFSAIYLLFIGPIDGVVLRLLKRQPWTWVTFPITIVVFSSIALAGTAWMKGSQAMVSTLEVVDLLPGTTLWRGEAYVGVFATQSTRIGLGTDVADSVAEPLVEPGYTPQMAVSGGYGPGRFSYDAATWTLGYTRLAWTDEAPGGIGFEVLPGGGWAVTNGLPFALRDAELHLVSPQQNAATGFHRLGALAPGQRVEVPATGAEGLLTDVGEPSTDFAWSRYRLLDIPSASRGYVEVDGLRFVLIAAADRITPVSVEGVRPIHRELTVIRAPLTPMLDPENLGSTPIPGAP